MPVEYVGSTPVASRLLRYTVRPKPGQTASERVLHIVGQHCRPETAEREFAMTRRKHGTQGATRKSPAKYELPEPNEVATHLRRTRPNGRRYWAVTRDGETATHTRQEGDIVRQAEARHLITSYDAEDVNPDDPDQVARAFAFTVARHKSLYPGEQATFVGQAEGKGKKFHVHTTRNATLFADMIVGGKLYKAGTKLAGHLTDIDTMRERADAFLAEHGAEYGLGPQQLATIKDQKRNKRSVMDRRMAARGEISNHDMIRDAWELSMDDPRTADLDSFVHVMAEHGVEVTAPGSRHGTLPIIYRLSYRAAQMRTPVRGKSLGERYDYAGAVAQLEAKAAGLMREPRPKRVPAGPPRSVAVPTAKELAKAQADVAQLGREERLHAWLDDWARDEYVTVEELLSERNFSLDIEADRERLHAKMKDWEAAGQAAPPTQPESQTYRTHPESKAQAQPWPTPEPQKANRAVETVELQRLPSSEEPALITGYESIGDTNTSAAAAIEKREQEQTSDSASPAPSPVLSVKLAALPLALAAAEKLDAPYRSRLRGVRLKNQKAQVHVDVMAAFDELGREALLRGERIDESTVPRIGPKFLEQFGDRLSPAVRAELQLRQAKMQRVRTLSEQIDHDRSHYLELRDASERDDPTGWQFSPEVRELTFNLKLTTQRLATLREQIASGMYEVGGHSPAALILQETGLRRQQGDRPEFGS